MLPYVLLIVVPVLFCYVGLKQNDNGRKTVVIGKNGYNRVNSLCIPVFFTILFLLLALRSKEIGRDLPNYEYIFNQYCRASLSEILYSSNLYQTEKGFMVLNWLIGLISKDFQWYMAAMAAVTVIPVAKLYAEDRRHGFLKIILYVNMSIFVVLFSGLRQSVAIGMGAIAYKYVREQKLIPFLAVCGIAMTMHHSSFMLFPMYFLYHMTWKKKHLLFVIPVIVAVFVFNQQIFGLMLALLPGEKYGDAFITRTNAYGSLILFALFALYCYILPDETNMDEETLGLRSFVLMAVALQCFAPLHALSMRLNYYYILFIPVAMAKVCTCVRVKYRKAAAVAEVILVAFFVIEFLSGIYQSYITGISSLDTVPYIPFWK